MIVLALDGPTPMFTMVSPARPGTHVMPGGHLAAVGVGAGAIRQGGAELLHVPGVVSQQDVPLERSRRPCRCSAAAGRSTGPSAPARTGTASCAASPSGSHPRPARARGHADRAPRARDRRRSGPRRPLAWPSSRSRYQRIALGAENSPSSTGLCADQGRSTVSRGYQPALSAASMASHSRSISAPAVGWPG